MLRQDCNSGHSAVQETAYRRPYEVLLLCQPLSAASEAAPLQGHDAARHEHAEKPPKQVSHSAQQPSKPLQNSVIIAVPGQHSRKPHLGRLLAPHLPTQPSCLEVDSTHAISEMLPRPFRDSV